MVGATMVWREGELIRYCLDYLTKNCKYVVVLLDNYDKKTENVVLEYKEKYGNKFFVVYSGLKGVENENVRGCLKRRVKGMWGTLRNKLLEEVKRVHEQVERIDMLLWLDGDEVGTDYLMNEIELFWHSPQKILAIRPIMVYDKLNLLRARTTIPNGRVYKYTPELNATPYRRAIYRPYTRFQVSRSYYSTVHLAYLGKEQIRLREKYMGTRKPEYKESRLWALEKVAMRYSHHEILGVQKKPHNFTVGEYLKQKYGEELP